MASKVVIGISWLITTLPEEAGFLESLIRCFRFLATSEVGGTFTGATAAAGDDGVDEESPFLF